MKPILKINFSDFWKKFKKEGNFFWRLLSPHFELQLSDKPDVLIYSVFGKEFYKYNCKRIFYTGETATANFNECDYALTFDILDNPKHFRCPIYTLYGNVNKGYGTLNSLLEPRNVEEIIARKNKFCAFVVSNPHCLKRNIFFEKLSKYKKVDSGGKFMNNVGGPVESKMAFINDYKFVISFENESYKGYTTEKIAEPLIVGSIPIYWGNPLVHLDFNPKSFINYHEFKNDEEVIAKIIEIDTNQQLYRQMLEQPAFHNNVMNQYCNLDNITQFLLSAINAPITPVAQTWKRHLSIIQNVKDTVNPPVKKVRNLFNNTLLKINS